MNLSAVFSRPDGAVLDLPGSRACIDGGRIAPSRAADFIPMPSGTLLLTMPGRSPLVWKGSGASTVDSVEGEGVDAVAAALPLGYTRTALPAFAQRPGAPPLPLYGYAAVAWSGDVLCVGAVKTDELESWSADQHAAKNVRAGIDERTREFSDSALIRQLGLCATAYGCYTAQNIFLRAGEGAIVVSPACNARCIGCISEQDPASGVLSAQARVRALPSVEEIAAIAVAHLEHAPNPIISFGQGCEGEPLLAADRIAAAIRQIREKTKSGIIHCNTNASRPAALRELLDAGLQSIRVSLNSARPQAYAAYYRPRGYTFKDVRESMKVAAERNASISLNLLTHPGVTDDPDEIAAFGALLDAHPIGMVQTRTLNVDPALYFDAVGRPAAEPIGMRAWLAWLRKAHPHLRVGNFTRGFG